MALTRSFFSVLVLLVMMIGCRGNPPNADSPPPTVILKADEVTLAGQTYATLQFTEGGLIWMAQNLNYEVTDSWCYNGEPEYCRQYGRLYTWEAAQRACRELGWRLPTDQEWRNVTLLFGGADSDSPDEGKQAYEALVDGGLTGFDALLGGFRYPSYETDPELDLDAITEDLPFDTSEPLYSSDAKSLSALLDTLGTYWTATETSPITAWSYNFGSFYGELTRKDDLYGKEHGKSCRCVKEP